LERGIDRVCNVVLRLDVSTELSFIAEIPGEIERGADDREIDNE
jgi:hypothetical protein